MSTAPAPSAAGAVELDPLSPSAPTWPSVTTVTATRSRPELLARAVRSMLEQDYRGTVEVVVVFDQSDPVPLDLGTIPPGRSVQVVRNDRSPGLMGARNTGLSYATGDLVAFCDDDDEWQPAKLTKQVEAWRRLPAAAVAATGMEVRTADSSVVRLPPPVVTQAMLVRDRVTAIHPSSTMYRRRDLMGRIGPVDEELPGGYGEDYELILRATRFGAVVCVTEPLTVVHWDRPSFFAGKWELVSQGLPYILTHVPEFAADRRGRARIEGQVAFAHAAVGRSGAALRWAARTARHDPTQARAPLAVAVALHLVSAPKVLAWLHTKGKGI